MESPTFPGRFIPRGCNPAWSPRDQRLGPSEKRSWPPPG
jgi:hypothetical protein